MCECIALCQTISLLAHLDLSRIEEVATRAQPEERSARGIEPIQGSSKTLQLLFDCRYDTTNKVKSIELDYFTLYYFITCRFLIVFAFISYRLYRDVS